MTTHDMQPEASGANPMHGQQQPGYEGQQPGFDQQSGFEGQQSGFEQRQPGYEGQQSGFDQQSGFEQRQPGFDGHQSGFDQQSGVDQHHGHVAGLDDGSRQGGDTVEGVEHHQGHHGVDAARDRSAESTGSAGTDGQTLFSDNDHSDLRARWTEVQSAFVDDPRECVQKADRLVTDLVEKVTAGFGEARSRLEGQWARGEEVSTEDLRVALRRYRDFFERLLTV